jgi:hypothetical protein
VMGSARFPGSRLVEKTTVSPTENDCCTAQA